MAELAPIKALAPPMAVLCDVGWQTQRPQPTLHFPWASAPTLGSTKSFLAFFDRVQEREAACGTAAAMRRTVAIEDVRRSPLFNVQSTPMFSGSGELLGIVSTHYQRPHKFTDHELDLLGYLAARTALMIDAFALLKA